MEHKKLSMPSMSNNAQSRSKSKKTDGKRHSQVTINKSKKRKTFRRNHVRISVKESNSVG